ncbi:hypothetical protein [Streptomyces sp. SID3343]|uniref:hypothetical protein n=1 Tax=Streptomyces sp. SID3343 TaxID=2690260 RepID=UPI001371F882|nr:hypothetical protein [Streptomyces sp. SID3343]MYV96712.1 hypothetical protein [Streptomyces sp. SID3343]
MDGLVTLAVSACLLGLTVLLVVRSLARRDLSTAPKDLLRPEALESTEWPEDEDTEWPGPLDRAGADAAGRVSGEPGERCER